jgi:transcription initiation factor TFIIIB Brf1 subunit/transcription initiation factor TFIIB
MSSTEQPKDIFALYIQNVDKFFNGIEKTIPNYHQSITDLQQEWLQAFENNIKSVVSLQQEFANKAGINTTVPEAALKAIRDTNEEIVKSYSVQNQVFLAAIDATKQNVKTFNDNAKSFADMNKNIMRYWISAFTPTRN